MVTYCYKASGTAADGQTWQVEGELEDEYSPGEFTNAVDDCLLQSFMKLTNGDAVYGSPGVGCNGPYRFTELTVKAKPTH